MPAASRHVFVNLPTADLAAATSFFTAVGFTFDPRFADDHVACLRLSDTASVLLLSHERFADFSTRPTADARATTAAIICVSAEDRDDVDRLADAALAAGATSAQDAVDYGFMYGRSFHDLDGHHWEVMWMDPAASEPGEASCPDAALAT